MPKVSLPNMSIPSTASPGGLPSAAPVQYANEVSIVVLNIEASAIFEYVSKEFYELFPNEKSLPCSFTASSKTSNSSGIGNTNFGSSSDFLYPNGTSVPLILFG